MTREQFLPNVRHPFLPVPPRKKVVEPPFVKFAEEISVVVAVDLGKPGVENFCSVPFPANGLYPPFGQDHVRAESRRDEWPKQDAIAPIKNRAPKPGKSGERS